MAKFIIPLDKLPPPYKNGNHYLRFRITTEDKNSLSQWSQIYDIESVGQISPTEVDAQVVSLQEGGPYEVNWREDISVELPSGSVVKRSIREYDIFVKWSYDSDFHFNQRVLGDRVRIFEEDGEKPWRERDKEFVPHIFTKSSLSSCHFDILYIGIFETVESNLSVIISFVISSEKNATALV
jgi:hypothetical protein